MHTPAHSATSASVVRILLVEDDDDDYLIVKRLLAKISEQRYQLDRAPNYDAALEALEDDTYEVYLIDYRLGDHTGLDMLRDLRSHGVTAPAIVLTGIDDREIDLEAMREGAADYLSKVSLEASSLEKSIRYAVERSRIFAVMDGMRQLFEKTLDALPQQVCILDEEGTLLAVNDSWRKMAEERGVPALLLERRTDYLEVYGYLAPADPAQAQALLDGTRDVLREGRSSFGMEYTLEEPPRNRVFSLQAKRFVVDGSPRVAIINEEITERVRAETDRLRLASIVESTDDAIAGLALDGTILSWNAGAAWMYGFSSMEAVGMSVSALVPDEQRTEIGGVLDTLRSGEPVRGLEMRCVRKDGTPIEASLTFSPIRGASGEIVGLSVIGRDVTTRKHLEEQLRHSQRMEAIGRLAGGVAHDFNNLLTIIVGYSDFLLQHVEAGSVAHKEVEAILSAGKRAADLTQQLLVFGRKQVVTPRRLDLNTVVVGLVKMLRRLIGEDINLTLELVGDPGLVQADPGQIEQVIVNLAVNARDEMPDGGSLTIKTTTLEIIPAVAVGYGIAPGDYVALVMSDTGPGIDREALPHIFEPFFTTKDAGKGTGLGLATVFGIATQNGGTVFAENVLGRGAVFTVLLPRVEGTLHSSDETVEPPAPKGRETILIAEDESSVLDLAAQALRSSGYTVLEANSGDEAIAICERHTGPLDLLLADVVMPRMNGAILAEKLTRLRPGVKVLFMSGYTGKDVLGRGVLESDVSLLPKPFTPSELARRVRAVLDTPAASSDELLE